MSKIKLNTDQSVMNKKQGQHNTAHFADLDVHFSQEKKNVRTSLKLK